MGRYIAVLILLLALTGIFKGLADRELFHRGYCTSEHWANKYAQPLEEAPDTWYYRTFDLKYKEAFPLSATLLVSLTDKWHRWDALERFCSRLLLTLTILLMYSKAFYFTFRENLWYGSLVYLVIWGLQALGFHFIYSWNII